MSNSCYKIKCRKSIHNLNMTNTSDSENIDSEEDLHESFESNELRYRKCDSEHDNSKNLSDVERTPIKKDKTSQFSGRKESIAFIIIVCTLIIASCAKHFSILKKESVSIDKLKQIFPNEPDDTFDNFETIIDEIVFEREIYPAVFLFLYTKNEEKVNKLVDHLATYGSQKLESDENYIDVHKDEFHTKEAKNDYGFLIDKYKADIIEKKVMLVKNLHNIPGETAQIFHSFCDEFSPLVKRVIYIFTLKVDSLTGKPEKIAETNLKRVWSDLDNDILMPLITRVTSTVLKISN